MAVTMNKRICSLETEYALISNLLTNNQVSREDLAEMIESTILAAHPWVRCNSFGRRTQTERTRNLVQFREGQFIRNGARVYYDIEHLEWANPETTTPRSALLYEKAAEQILVTATALVKEQLRKKYPQSWLMLVKNNIDYVGGTSYGCHENYSLRRFDEQGQDIFARLEDDLVPFLVTRQIFCGSGRIGTRFGRPNDAKAFQLSQRADFIENLISPHTRTERSILNLRDEPLAANDWRRLHLILGDSNMSEVATFLKIGTTMLALSLLEENLINGRWALRDPVDALHCISRDWQNTTLPLRRGGSATALAIQRAYWQTAVKMSANLPENHFARQVLDLWEQTLDDLEFNRPRLYQTIDWAIKQHHLFNRHLQAVDSDWEELGEWIYVVEQTRDVPMPPDETLSNTWIKRHLPRSNYRQLERYIKLRRLNWDLYPSRRKLLSKLYEMDFRYHDIHPQTGLYAILTKAGQPVERLLPDAQEIASAQRRPPEDTRAWQRGQIIKISREKLVEIEMDWNKIFLVRTNRTLPMPDPFLSQPINLNQVPEFDFQATEDVEPSSSKKINIKVISVENLGRD